MTIEIALLLVALALVVFATSRVIAPKGPTAVRQEEPPQRSYMPLRGPHYVPRQPHHFALPPVTIETLPIDFTQVPQLVPPIDHKILAALASGSRVAAEVPRPDSLARGSIPPGSDLDDAETLTSQSDLDAAETLRAASDLDEDALTCANMSPVR